MNEINLLFMKKNIQDEINNDPPNKIVSKITQTSKDILSNIFKINDTSKDLVNSKLSSKIPKYDIESYVLYNKHNFVYDKLWIAQTQNLKCGKLEDLNINEAPYPIFIKPRYGHKTSSSKNCYKIKNAKEIKKFLHLKNMMWSEFLPATETMTDFILHKGNIVFQLTYLYSDKQNGFSDDFKTIDCNNKPSPKIISWVNTYLKSFTGVVNIQSRGNIVIEVGLRFARGGTYIISTKNDDLINNINNLFNNKTWDYSKDLTFEKFYSFKCFSKIPILYILPQYITNKFFSETIFHDYYFEPVGKFGDVFYQFSTRDFEYGLEKKKEFEKINYYLQSFFILFAIIIILLFIIDKKTGYCFILIYVILYLSRLLNPISTNLMWLKVLITKLT